MGTCAPPRPSGPLGGVALTAASTCIVVLMAARLSRLLRWLRRLHSDSRSGSSKPGVPTREAASVVLLASAAKDGLKRRGAAGISGEKDLESASPLESSTPMEASTPLESSLPTDASLGPNVGENSEEAESEHVQFNPRVACILVRDLTELTSEQKATFWWQQQDFNEFLQVRVEIGKAYRAAAKKIGVDVMQVSSVGSHGDEGYRAMIEAVPRLADESRRGLGLGRKRQRAKNRDMYIAAVLDEQRRQREDAAEEDTSVPVDLDVEAVARAAQKVSEKDRKYAHYLAQQYFEQDRAVEANDRPVTPKSPATPAALGKAGEDAEAEHHMARRTSCPSVPLRERKDSDMSTASNGSNDETSPPTMQRRFSFNLSENLSEELDSLDLAGDFTHLRGQESGAPSDMRRMATKGFGLSKDMLREVGLSANGHALSRSRLSALGSGHMSEDSGGETGGETEDEDSPIRRGQAGSQSESFRLDIGPVFSSTTDTKTYGSRNHYRNWRAWAKAQPSAK